MRIRPIIICKLIFTVFCHFSENNGYTEVQTFKRHTNYVVCSTVLKNSKVLPDGLILTGSNDKLICGFTSKVPEVILIEASHKDTGNQIYIYLI